MSNNLFYKALAAVSSIGIVVIAGIQVTTALKKGTNIDDQTESHWLVYGAQHSSVHRGSVIDKLEMKDEKQCLEEGPKLEFFIRPSQMSNRDFNGKIFDDVAWGCIKGK